MIDGSRVKPVRLRYFIKSKSLTLFHIFVKVLYSYDTNSVDRIKNQ